MSVKTIVAVGDSITWSTLRYFWQACDVGLRYGQAATPRYDMSHSHNGHVWLNAAFPGWRIQNLEVQAGETPLEVTDPPADGINRIDTLINWTPPAGGGRSTRENYLVVMIGTNPTGIDPGVSAERIGDYCAARVAAGWNVIICTIIGRGDGIIANFDSSYAAPLNNYIRGTTALPSYPGEYFMAHYGVTACCDFGSLPEFTPNGSSFNSPIYYNQIVGVDEKVHPTELGGVVMAIKFNELLTTLFGASQGTAPANTVAPVLDNAAPTFGDTITPGAGTWTNSPTAYEYQWFRGVSPITGANSLDYTTVQADVGQTLFRRTTALNAYGRSSSVDTLPCAEVTQIPTLAPSGDPVCTSNTTDPAPAGSTLSTTDGTWLGYPAPTFAYANNGTNGGTSNSVLVDAADEGNDIYFTVTASNSVGNTPANSNAIHILVPIIIMLLCVCSEFLTSGAT